MPLVFTGLLHTILINAYEPTAPNICSCSQGLGEHLNRLRCEIAGSEIPQDATLRTFSTKEPSENDDWIGLPQRFADSHGRPECVIAVELEGHSQTDISLVASWDTIRTIAFNVITNCVDRQGWGGWETFGLDRTFRALIPPQPYEVPTQPAVVVNPDGPSDTIVAMPEGAGGPNGFSELRL